MVLTSGSGQDRALLYFSSFGRLISFPACFPPSILVFWHVYGLLVLYVASDKNLVCRSSQERKGTGNFRALPIHQKSSLFGKFCNRNQRCLRISLVVGTWVFCCLFSPLLPSCHKKGNEKDEGAFSR